MATLILGTVGQIFGGPIGGIIGTALGGLVDRSVLGSTGRAREQGRISNPAVQSATYGEPIPVIVGRMRAAGNLIWTSGIREQSTTVGGGKRSGPATTNYSYSASFAVGLVARRIAGLGRIWADGKLICGSDGVFTTPVIMRLHNGDEDQPVDPLIAAAEAEGGTPAYRGLAYVVFEDLPLAEFGNRIPNLTFEIIADAAPIDAGIAIARLSEAAGDAPLTMQGSFPAITGHIVSRTGTLAEAIAPLLAISDAVMATGEGLAVVGADVAVIGLPADVGDTHRPGDDRRPERLRRSSADFEAGCLELAFYDASRDYQPGVERVRRSSRATVDLRSISAAMSPGEARGLALRLLAAGQAGRITQTLRLPWRHLDLRAGSCLRLGDAADIWRVRELRFENFVVHLDLQRVPQSLELPAPAGGVTRMVAPMAARQADPAPVGATTLHVLDLPILPGEVSGLPRLWVAGAGAGAGWRRAGVAASLDGGASYVAAGTLEGGSIIGTTLSRLAAGTAFGWDRFASVEVELLSDRDWIEGCAPATVLAGGNLALVGDELLQFMHADAIAPRRFRLHGLLRGRRGTEACIDRHAVGERFVVIDPARMLQLEPPFEALGGMLRVLPVGAGDGDAQPLAVTIAGMALRPLSPAHLQAHRRDGTLVVNWVRRSRSGFAWTDLVDAPLGEADEAYVVRLNGRGFDLVRQVDRPEFVCPLADLRADGDIPTHVTIGVAQISATTGAGAFAETAVTLSA
jgi:hypothetical protein